ncbi:hypothetical protein Tco_0223128, partial [Tanacetum coccineum]
EPTMEPVCESVTPRFLPEHDSNTPCKDSVFEVIDDVMRQLSFEEIELDGEAGFADVTGSGVESTGLSHHESFRVDDLDLNLNERVNLNVSKIETQYELLVSEEPNVGRSPEPIVEEVRTQEPIVEDVIVEDYVSSGEDAEQGNGQFFYDDKGIDTAYETEYDVQSSEDAGTDDDDEYEDFLVDKENEIVELNVDVHLFGISMDVPFDNIDVTYLVPDDVLEGEDVDVINADDFDSDPGNDDEIKITTTKEAKDRLYVHSIESRRNLMMYKNDSVRIRERCNGKVPVFTMSQGTGPTGPNCRMEVGPSGSSGPSTRSKQRKNTGTNDDSQACSSVLDAHDKGDLCHWVLAKAKAEREIRGDHVLQYSMLIDYVVKLQSSNPNTTVKIEVERNTDPSLPTRVF